MFTDKVLHFLQHKIALYNIKLHYIVRWDSFYIHIWLCHSCSTDVLHNKNHNMLYVIRERHICHYDMSYVKTIMTSHLSYMYKDICQYFQPVSRLIGQIYYT